MEEEENGLTYADLARHNEDMEEEEDDNGSQDSEAEPAQPATTTTLTKKRKLADITIPTRPDFYLTLWQDGDCKKCATCRHKRALYGFYGQFKRQKCLELGKASLKAKKVLKNQPAASTSSSLTTKKKKKNNTSKGADNKVVHDELLKDIELLKRLQKAAAKTQLKKK